MSKIKEKAEKVDKVEKGPNAQEQEAHNSLFLDAYNFCKDTANHPGARLRQAEVISIGTISGCIKEGHREIVSNPFELAGKVAIAGATGAALGTALAAESPVIVGGALIVGVIGTGSSLWHTYSNLANSKYFQHNMDAVFKSRDQHSLGLGIKAASDVVGPEAFNYAIAFGSGFGSTLRPKLAATISAIPYFAKLTECVPGLKSVFKTSETYAQYIPMPKATGGATVEMYFKDGSTIHAHTYGNTAMLRAGGVEYVVDTNKNGINLAALISPNGRQIVKGLSQEKLPLELYIDPIAGRTKVVGYGKTWEYQHSTKVKNSLDEWFSCRKCNPLKKPKGKKS